MAARESVPEVPFSAVSRWMNESIKAWHPLPPLYRCIQVVIRHFLPLLLLLHWELNCNREAAFSGILGEACRLKDIRKWRKCNSEEGAADDHLKCECIVNCIFSIIKGKAPLLFLWLPKLMGINLKTKSLFAKKDQRRNSSAYYTINIYNNLFHSKTFLRRVKWNQAEDEKDEAENQIE